MKIELAAAPVLSAGKVFMDAAANWEFSPFLFKKKTVAVCGYSGQVTLWALDSDKPKLTRAIKSPGYCVAFAADGKGVFTGHDNGTVAFTPTVGK